MTSDYNSIPAKSLGKMQPKSDENLFKTSYEAFFSKNKIQKERKKSQKKFVMNSLDFYSSHNNVTGYPEKLKEDRMTPNSKKIFKPVYNKKSLVNMYRGDLGVNTKYEPVQPDILHAFSTKKHYVNFKFSFYSFVVYFFKNFFCFVLKFKSCDCFRRND